MEQPNVSIGCVKNLFVRQMHFAKVGDGEQGHVHNFDHMTLLAKGRLSIRIDDEVTEFTAPQMIYIKAELKHELVALTENTVAYCIHALRDSSGDILSPEMVPNGRALYDLMRGLVVR